MVTIAVVTLSHHKLQEQEGRWLKLISGLVMTGYGGSFAGCSWLPYPNEINLFVQCLNGAILDFPLSI
jgi:hypothetical protein